MSRTFFKKFLDREISSFGGVFLRCILCKGDLKSLAEWKPFVRVLLKCHMRVKMTIARKPLIGLTLDFNDNKECYSKYPWYALRENYCSSISKAGGIPLPLPHEIDCIPQYAEFIDGLIVTGGDFDIDPSYFGEEIRHERVSVKKNRTLFEFTLTKEILRLNKPVLGICGGEQLLNVVLGGSLIQHIPDEHPSDIQHEQPNPRCEPGHLVKIVSGTRLEKWVKGKKEIPVNSAHHQAVKKVPEGVVVNAYAPDGLIEGIEHPGYKFCLGLQWHPEFSISPADDDIMKAFIDAAGEKNSGK
jgi:putative glutamine amidotransferase